jgi:hypothetical protein
MEFWRWLYLGVGAAISLVLCVRVARNAARVSRRVREFKEELAARQGPPPDPFRELAELYAEQERLDQAARARRKKG